MSIDRVPDTHCNTCRKQMTIMKRCTRCKRVVYCSRDCQMKDWPDHQLKCQTGKVKDTAPSSSSQGGQPGKFQTNDYSIFSDESNTEDKKPISHPPLVDWSKAFGEKKSAAGIQKKELLGNEKTYLYKNEHHSDIPKLDETKAFSKVSIRCNKAKQNVKLQKSWTGNEIFKFLSHSLKVPLEKLKIIHKGKVLSEETIVATVTDKAVYQVIGEMAESEDGLDQRDIEVMMKQLGIDRNGAVKALKTSGDLIDAMLGQ